MRRYWLGREAFQTGPNHSLDKPASMIGAEVRIEGDSLHHIRDVCRQTVGDRFEALFEGSAYFVEIVQEKKREFLAIVREVREIAPLPHPRIRVALAIPRFNVLEGVLEKLVEMGVETVQPLFSDNSFIRTATETWASKETRFQKIIQSATQQCGRGEKMSLEPARRLSDFLASEFGSGINRNGGTEGLFAYEVGTAPIRDVCRSLAARKPAAVWVFIGGEGGFSPSEVQEFKKRGLEASTLGPQVLRVETACVALVSVLKYELDLMRNGP